MLSPENNIPTSNSTAQDWKQWYESLAYFFSRKDTNALFTKAWDARGGTSARGNTEELRTFLKTKGLTIETTGVQDIVDFSAGIGTSVSNGVSDFLKVGKFAGISLVVIVIGGLAMIVFSIGKDVKGTISAVKH